LSKTSTLLLGLLFVLMLMPADILSAAPLPPSFDTRLRAGIENLRQENYEEAIEDLEQARSLMPSSSRAAYYLGVAYKKTQDFERARKNLEDAVTLRPAVREAVVELADIFFQTGENKKAMAQIEVAEREGISPAETAFLKGLVLIKLKRYNEAVLNLENAAALDENLSSAADYHIGLARMLLGSLEEARDIFYSTVLRDPNSDLAIFASEYIDAITRRLRKNRPLRLTAGVSLMYDDNVLLKPGDETAAGNVTDEGDSAYAVNFRAGYTRPLEGPYSLEAQYSFYLLDFFELSSHDVMSHAVTVSPVYASRRGSAGVPMSFNYTLVNGSGYLRTFRVEPTYSFGRGTDTFIRASVGIETNSYVNEPSLADEDRDNLEMGLRAEWYHLIGKPRATAGPGRQGFVTVRYGLVTSESDGRNWRHYTNTFGAGALYPVGKRWTASASGDAAIQNFTATHTVFGKKRRDRTYTLGSEVSYSLRENVDLQTRLTYIRGESNIAIYDHDKFVVSVGLEVGL
jgi:tetratricopeptide (TPR) repeat protein